jgi:hypothetical protein
MHATTVCRVCTYLTVSLENSKPKRHLSFAAETTGFPGIRGDVDWRPLHRCNIAVVGGFESTPAVYTQKYIDALYYLLNNIIRFQALFCSVIESGWRRYIQYSQSRIAVMKPNIS